MSLIMVGASHRLAPTSLRERLAVPADRLPAALAALVGCEHVDEVVLVATCNRTEVYAEVSSGSAADVSAADREIRAFYGSFFSMGPDELAPYLWTQTATAAVNHLLRVASGLESMVLGEYEILGQVKRALAAATDAGVAKHRGLAATLRQAVATGKRVRTETAIGRGPVSLASGALVAAKRCLHRETLKGTNAVVIGAGQLGGLVARALAQAGASLRVVNRSPERGASLAHACGGTFVALADLEAALGTADLVISAAGAPDPVLGAALLSRVAAGRPNRPLAIVDLAMPRDVDPNAAGIAGLILHTLADVQGVLEESLGGRRREVPRVEAIIATELESFLAAQRRAQLPASLARWAGQQARTRAEARPGVLAAAQLG